MILLVACFGILLISALFFSLSGAIVATTIIILPIMYQGLKSAFLSIDHELVWAAETLSANKNRFSQKLFYRIAGNQF